MTCEIFGYSRIIPVEGSKVTSALWGPFDEFLITGHENGAVCRYDVTRVRYVCMCIHACVCVCDR